MSDSIDAVVVRAADLAARGHARRAIGLLRPALVRDPQYAEGWCRLAAAHLDVGEADSALAAARRALTLGGHPAWAQRLAALALSDLGRHAEAAVAARACVGRSPDDWRCRVVLAEVLTASGRPEALDAAREATRLAPAQPRAFQVLGDAASRVHDWGTAERAYHAAVRLDPADQGAHADLALVRRRRGLAVPTGAVLAEAEKRAWPVLSRVTGLLVAGGLLLLLAGLPRPTPPLAWVAVGVVVAALLVTALTLLRARAVGRRALVRLLRRRPIVLAALVAAGISIAAFSGWAAALFLGATTMQPLVVGWLCAVAGGVVVLLGR
ncbi:hypothetical protein GCM10022243_60840 [Saccharothrix violaceirubra]|uniref:Tetratricopeptide (TPR) repeat protein n=1 Tax=Saccharothrix violaceirubra TaxID=413306 RepID=A0A7W7WY50_9PSEU|nr:hypothetical protein [Saccharothrix violaceirubra]MBB4968060.1 tetratricopeptide (TPR) repeat protein [Saccharothrix violaceirubra]